MWQPLYRYTLVLAFVLLLFLHAYVSAPFCPCGETWGTSKYVKLDARINVCISNASLIELLTTNADHPLDAAFKLVYTGGMDTESILCNVTLCNVTHSCLVPAGGYI